MLDSNCGVMLPAAVCSADEFMLHDNNVVAFLGDSITARAGIPRSSNSTPVMRYPDRKIRFYNAGKGGDTAQTSIARLDRDVFSHNATVMLSRWASTTSAGDRRRTLSKEVVSRQHSNSYRQMQEEKGSRDCLFAGDHGRESGNGRKWFFAENDG